MNDSKYCYPGTDILINKFNIRDQEKLTKIERLVTANRLVELINKPIYGKFDLKHLQQIHQYIFQDIYPFAGKIRDVDIAKQSTLFCKAPFIQFSAKDLFDQLKKEKYLQNLSHEAFSDRAAYYMGEINMLHPFREGNGRTQREFIRTLAMNAGYELDWSRVPAADIYKASVRSVYDPGDLAKVIKDCIVNREPNKDLIKQFQNQRGLER